MVSTCFFLSLWQLQCNDKWEALGYGLGHTCGDVCYELLYFFSLASLKMAIARFLYVRALCVWLGVLGSFAVLFQNRRYVLHPI